VEETVRLVEASAAAHLPGWRVPGMFAGHVVGADVRADLCYTLHHLAEAGVESVAGQPIDEVLTTLLGAVDGRSTHTFFSYRVAEVLGRVGLFAGNHLLEGLTDEQRREVELAVDSSDWLELLDGGFLPRNYAAVLSRCELGRVRLGLVDDTARLDELVGRLAAVLGENPTRALDDSNDRIGRYDIYTGDVWLFCEPLADHLGDLWDDGINKALDLVLAVGSRDGSAVPWGRSVGDLAAALTLELAALALSDERVRARRSPDEDAVWLRRAADATETLLSGFGDDGVSTAHQHRDQDSYRGPERRLQLTYDLLGKVAWAAGALRKVDPSLEAAPIAEAYPAQDRWIGFEESVEGAPRPAGVWAHRSPGVDFVLPFVGTTRSHYLPAPRQPGTWEVPVDRDLPCWTPLVSAGLGRYTAGGVPASVEVAAGAVSALWSGLAVSGRGLDGDDPGPPLAGTRNMTMRVDGRSLVLEDQLTFDQAPRAVSLTIPEVADRPLRVEWSSLDGDQLSGAATTVAVDGIDEWRSFWSAFPRVHQLDLDPAPEVSYRARVTPLMRVASTAFGHHYHRSLYEPMSDRVVDRPTPVGWDAVPDPGFRHLDLLHVHWPEWVAFDDLAAHRSIIHELADHDVPIVWTAHNLTPHEKREEVYEPIYAAWAEAADSVIHHSAWGMARMRERYEFRPDCRHEVIAHGHFGGLWDAASKPDRETAETWLGLEPCALRIGIVGAPRSEKLVRAVLEGVAASSRDDVQVVCWSLGLTDAEPGWSVPDDPRIAIAERYRMVDPAVYATRLAACDVLALVFDPEGDMLATGAAADAIGLAMPALRSDWGYLVENLGEAGIAVGHTAESIAAAIDSLSPERVAEAQAAAEVRKAELDWAILAERTADLFERTILREQR
jgi:glycosyltransferase involved in cell wall biosynthesis